MQRFNCQGNLEGLKDHARQGNKDDKFRKSIPRLRFEDFPFTQSIANGHIDKKQHLDGEHLPKAFHILHLPPF